MSENSSSNPQKQSLLRGIALSIGVALWVIVAFFIAGIGVFGAFLSLEKAGITLSSVSPASIQLAQAAMVYLLTLAIAVYVPKIVVKNNTSLKDIGLDRLPYWKDIGLACVSFVPYVIISTGLVLLATTYLPGFDSEQVQDIGFDRSSNRTGLILAFVTLVVLAPVAEEALFRGYLYGKMRKATNVFVAIVLTSIAFAVVHGQVNVGIDVFALSVILCLLREFTGSIWAGVLLHMIKNAIAFYFLFIYVG